MSGETGSHIQEEILKRLPVKSLLKFRSVCKAWRSLIDSSYFIAAHAVHQNRWKHVFVRYVLESEARFVSIVDDDTFPQQKFVPTLPLSVKRLGRSAIVGSCNGLVCLDGYYYNPDKKRMSIIWNPSIRKSIAIPVPLIPHEMDQSAFGFGVCPVTNDPKIVMFPQRAPLHEKNTEINDPPKVMIYTLSSGKWRSLSPSSNVPSKTVKVKWYSQVIDRFIYWFGSHRRPVDVGVQWTSNLIMSFDMTNDTFQVITLPNSLVLHPPAYVSISKLRESLVVLQESFNSDLEHCDVWMMENSVGKSFTKIFKINVQHELVRVLGFRKSGIPIMEVEDYRYEESEIVVYEPNSEHFNDVGIYGVRRAIAVNSYMETLLLLDRSDCNS